MSYIAKSEREPLKRLGSRALRDTNGRHTRGGNRRMVGARVLTASVISARQVPPCARERRYDEIIQQALSLTKGTGLVVGGKLSPKDADCLARNIVSRARVLGTPITARVRRESDHPGAYHFRVYIFDRSDVTFRARVRMTR